MNAPRRLAIPGVDRDPTLSDVEELLGAEVGRQIAETFAGRRLYLPREPGRHHPISVTIGEQAALELGRVLGGAHIDVPLSPGRRARIVALSRQGRGPLEIQRLVQCSRRLVFQVLAEAREASDEDQPRLL
jgi:hypothetical protein